ncbi:hypothetical protein ACQ4N7_07495 [Nodosilinea sp. AN01ver1]|uniref:hypothetical protein n=1 Tax=Nodosilinea sp. AN01ver1 TaxID=3423362 RepID=UPI003D30FDC6
MFTGLDLVVIVLVLAALFYATSPPSKDKDASFKFEPLTLVVVAIIVGMIAFSLLNR